MSRIAIADVYVPPEVDLWGHLYVVRPITKALQDKIGPIEDELERKMDNAKDGAESVAALGRYLDVLLKTSDEDGKGKKPSTLLREKWSGGDLSVQQIRNFMVAVVQAEADSRPT